MVELSTELGIRVNSVMQEAMNRHKKKCEQDRAINNSEMAKLRRQQRKVFKHIRMAKEDAKKGHKSEKMLYKDSCKSSVSKRKCEKCTQKGHDVRLCHMPELDKKGIKVKLFDWYTEYNPEVVESARKKMRKPAEVKLFNW